MNARLPLLLALLVVSISASAGWGEPQASLPGSAPLTWEDDLSVRMMDGAHRFVEARIDESILHRERHWKRDPSSREAYEKSIGPNRARFLKIIGAVDARVPVSMEHFGDDSNPALVAETGLFRVFQVRWPVLDGVHGEGLHVVPRAAARARAVVLPDADQTPEQILGLSAGVHPENQFARRLAENGFELLLPTLVDRTTSWSGNPGIRMTDQTHREWIYRQAYQMGRHTIGYEVQKVLSAVDWFRGSSPSNVALGVAGYGEGGLLAFYSAAVDPRIDAVLVSGYFEPRQKVWAEPIYRNVWGLLREFGDAELATLVAPRSLIVEYCEVPAVRGHKGDLTTPELDAVRAEFERIEKLPGAPTQRRRLIAGGPAEIGPGAASALTEFAAALGVDSAMSLSANIPADRRRSFDSRARQRRQVRELERHVQELVRDAEQVRDRYFLLKAEPRLGEQSWSRELRHPTFSPRNLIDASGGYRAHLRDEILGRFEEPLLLPSPRAREVYNTDKWTGYEVVLDVWKDVFAWGILLVPKGMQPGERRPVVVCQHGRQGVPREVVEGDNPAYRNFAARLADRGFVVFAPHNLYRGEDRYRWLDRKANGVKASLFSFILGQHEQILRWLSGLPFVDAARIGFYGLSYGGETAMRIPAVLPGYSLSICSGDFNSWTPKVASTHERFSFMFTIEWEMPYFDMGNTFDYAEMAYLIFPRPFMVERGHHDRVGRDAWVAHEYAKVRWLYKQMDLADRTEIEYFNGGHTINGEGTFRFLHRHLNWPEP